MRAGFLGAFVLALGVPTGSFGQTVTLTPTPNGITADYRLDATSDRMAFAQADTNRTDWSVTTPNVSLTPNDLVSTAETDRFTVQLRPDSSEDGRGYIALTRLGEGYILYAPALTADGKILQLEADLPEGWGLLPGPAFDGYVYVGPTSAVQRGATGAIRIASESSPSAASATLFETFDKALAFFTQTFGPLPRTPVMSVTQQGAGPMPFRGDVTDSGMISIRFHGDISNALDTSALSQLEHFAFHETTHLWNSHLARPTEGSPWLHEGGAEYLALVGSASIGRIDQTEALAGLSQRLTDCRNALSDRSDILARISTGAAVYDCGTVIQWLADMELRQEGGQPKGVISVWTDLISRARQGQADYGPGDLKARLGPGSAVVAMLDGPAETRWSDLETILKRLNVRWVNRPSDASLMTAALRHLKRQACTGGVSYSLRNGSIEMENGPDCGQLSGTVTLVAVEGHDPLTSSASMFEAVQQRCARRESLNVTLRSREATIAVPCVANLATPTAYALTQAPPIALPGAL